MKNSVDPDLSSSSAGLSNFRFDLCSKKAARSKKEIVWFKVLIICLVKFISVNTFSLYIVLGA